MEDKQQPKYQQHWEKQGLGAFYPPTKNKQDKLLNNKNNK